MITVTATDIFDFATTTGHLYKTHCMLAKEKASTMRWLRHIRGPIKRAYLTEITRGATCTIPETAETQAAIDLRAYYERHIQETV
jgi:hypothetical protein